MGEPYDGAWFADRLHVVRGEAPHDYMAECPACGSRDNLHVTDEPGGAKVFCFGCQATAAEVIEALDGPAVLQARPATKARPKERPASDPMAWWVAYTGVPAKVWREMGVEVERDGIAFTFGDLDARKHRRAVGDKQIWWSGRLTPVLWPTPGDELSDQVHVTVSESDAGSLKACGLNEVFALTKGDKGTAELFRAFRLLRDRGARRVVIWTDAEFEAAARLWVPSWTPPRPPAWRPSTPTWTRSPIRS